MESMTSFVKGRIEIETEMDRHSVRCDDVDEIESRNKIEGPRHSVRSDDNDHHNKGLVYFRILRCMDSDHDLFFSFGFL